MDIFDFSFLKSDNAKTPSVDQPSSQSPASASVAVAREEISRSMETSKARRGRPQEIASTGGDDTRTLQAEIARQLEGCYDPKAWGALLTLPADAAHTYTGRKYWEVGKEERETLGATGSAAARTLMITDPRGLAFLMVGAALFSCYLPRVMQEMRYQKAQADKKNEPPKAA